MAGCLAQRYLAARGRRGVHIRSLTEAMVMLEAMGACDIVMRMDFAVGQLGRRTGTASSGASSGSFSCLRSCCQVALLRPVGLLVEVVEVLLISFLHLVA